MTVTFEIVSWTRLFVVYSDTSSNASSNEDEASTNATGSGRQFPKEAHEILENFYARGMTGWGAKNAAELEVYKVLLP